MPNLICPAQLEVPPGEHFVYCRLQLGHVGKHEGGRAGKRYRWANMNARAARLVPWGQIG